jgi:hypothetical protein
MKRCILVVALLAIGLTATPASAATRTPFEPIPLKGFVFPAGALCPFKLKVKPVVSNEYITTLPDGSQLITGALSVRLSDLDSGASLVLNISGPSRVSADGSTIVAYGPSLEPFFGAHPELILFYGRVVLFFAADGSATVVSQHGASEDACALVG